LRSNGVAAVLVAAGSGKRFGGFKQFALLMGKPLWRHAADAFLRSPEVRALALVLPPGKPVPPARLPASRGKIVLAVEGGRHRHLSVRRGVEALRRACSPGVVLVHDGARPLLTPALMRRVASGARRYGAAALARAVTDTTVESGSRMRVGRHLDRRRLFAMETPQGFRLSLWDRALSRVPRGRRWSDESSFLAAAGIPVRLVPHEGWNPKITRRADIGILKAFLLAARTKRRP
jgi:2-C-methyl-D-erythritol 4-phosphate cytidylyltransferase